MAIIILNAFELYRPNRKKIFYSLVTCEHDFHQGNVIRAARKYDVKNGCGEKICSYCSALKKKEKFSFLGKKHTLESKLKISKAHKGSKLSEEHKKKISDSSKGNKNHFFNKTHSQQTKIKIGFKNKGKLSKEKNPNWNPDRTWDVRRKERKLPENFQWTKSVLKRDNYTCQICNKRKWTSLISHHLDGYGWCKEKRYNTENGVCLCKECHKNFHSIFGYKNNTIQQFIQFYMFHNLIINK